MIESGRYPRGLCRVANRPSVIVRQKDGRGCPVPFCDDPDSFAVWQRVAGQQTQTCAQRKLVLLPVALGYVAPVTAYMTDQQVDKRDASGLQELQRGRCQEDPAGLETRSGLVGGRQIHGDVLHTVGVHRHPA